MKMTMRSWKQIVNNASRSLIIDRSKPGFITYSSAVISSSFTPDYYKQLNHQEIPSSSLFDGFIKTTRRMSRFYKRTFSEFEPSSLLVRPTWSEETDEAVHFYITMSGMSDEDINISVEKNKTVTIIGEGDGVFEAEYGYKKAVCYIDLPDIDSPVKIYTTRGIKADMIFWTGVLELIIPKLKQHEKQDDDDQRNTFNITVNRTFKEYQEYNHEDDQEEDDEDEDEDDYDYSPKMGPIKLVQLPPIINKCLNISSQIFLSTLNDGHRHRLNLAINSIHNFIYINIMNRFGLFTERVYGSSGKGIKTSIQETDEFLYYYFKLNGVVSHEKVGISVYYNKFLISGAVYDEFKATHHVSVCIIELQPEDTYFLKYNMKDIKADFCQKDGDGELKLTILKFDAAQRMINEKKNEAGEFSMLKDDAFMFTVKINASI